jgi:hypothetical protein
MHLSATFAVTFLTQSETLIGSPKRAVILLGVKENRTPSRTRPKFTQVWDTASSGPPLVMTGGGDGGAEDQASVFGTSTVIGLLVSVCVTNGGKLARKCAVKTYVPGSRIITKSFSETMKCHCVSGGSVHRAG